MPPSVERRLVILAEGNFGFHHGKTAMGVIRFGHDKVVAVIDSTQAGHNVREWLGDSGRNDIPIVGTAQRRARLPAAGQRAADRHRAHRRQAARRLAGRDPRRDPVRPRRAVRPAHVPRRRPRVRRGRAHVRRPADRLPAPARAHGHGRRAPPRARASAWSCSRWAPTARSARCPSRSSCGARRRRPGARRAFVATGQTGIMIEGWGVAVDRVIADFLQGTVEWLVEDGESRGDWVIVEGQGSLDHPAYSSVTLGLIHGATPHAMVMVHKPGHGRPRLRPPARGAVPDRAAAPVHRRPTRRWPAGRPVARSSRWRSTPR